MKKQVLFLGILFILLAMNVLAYEEADVFNRTLVYEDGDFRAEYSYYSNDSQLTFKTIEEIWPDETITSVYNQVGQMVDIVYDEHERDVKYSYNSRGLVESDLNDGIKNIYFYDDEDRIIKMVTEVDNKILSRRYYYDTETGFLIESLYPSERRRREYNDDSLLEKLSYIPLPEGSEETQEVYFMYDEFNNIIGVSDNLGRSVNYTYEKVEYMRSILACLDADCNSTTIEESPGEYYELGSRRIENDLITVQRNCVEEGSCFEEYCSNTETECYEPEEEYEEGLLLRDDYVENSYEDGKLTMVKGNPRGDVVELDYDASSLIDNAKFDMLQKEESYRYDASGRLVVVAVKDLDGAESSYYTGNAISNFLLGLITGNSIFGEDAGEDKYYLLGEGTYFKDDDVDYLTDYDNLPIGLQEVLDDYYNLEDEEKTCRDWDEFMGKKASLTNASYVSHEGYDNYDYCLNDMDLVEYSCRLDIRSLGYAAYPWEEPCKYGCFEGACLTSPRESCFNGMLDDNEDAIDCGGGCPACVSSCVDYDGMNGFESSAFNKSYVSFEGREYRDECLDDDSVIENYCGYGSWFRVVQKNKTKACDFGCFNGACFSEAQIPQCENGIQDGYESGIDCGGYCNACVDYEFNNGTGTPEDPYVIYTCEGLGGINDDLDAYYVLGEDLNCDVLDQIGGDVVDDPDAGFTGSLDGKGRSISFSDIKLNPDHYPSPGLFYYNWGTVKNLEINVGYVPDSVSEHSSAGLLAGSNSGEIENVYVFVGNAFSEFRDHSGVIVAYNYGSLKNSYVEVLEEFEPAEKVGCLVAYNYGSLDNSFCVVDDRCDGYGLVVGGSQISNSYGSSECESNCESCDVDAKISSSEIGNQNHPVYSSWDFTNIWEMKYGQPQLRVQNVDYMKEIIDLPEAPTELG